MMRTVIETRYAKEFLDRGSGVVPWVLLGRARGAPDGLNTSVNGDNLSTIGALYSFGFTIPDGATPLALEATIWRCKGSISPTSTQDVLVMFYLGASLQGNNEADSATDWPVGTVGQPAFYDGRQNSDDLWGVSLTPAQYRSSGTGGFGFGFMCQFTQAGLVDSAAARLTYQVPNAWSGPWIGRKSAAKRWFGGG